MTEKEKGYVKLLCKAAGVEIDVQKHRFVFTDETLFHMVLQLSRNEFARGHNHRLCKTCKLLQDNGGRHFDNPGKVFPFCEKCEKKEKLMANFFYAK